MSSLTQNQSVEIPQPDCPFIRTYFENHRPNVVPKQKDDQLMLTEKMFLAFFKVGIFDTYQFLYQDCRDATHFNDWLIGVNGIEMYIKSVQDFNEWLSAGVAKNACLPQLLGQSEMDFWAENGYLKVSGLVPDQDCEEVVSFIKNHLGIQSNDPESWYQPHESLQGLMFQHYQADCIYKIRDNPNLQAVFAQLYGNQNIIPNTEKLSYNPPENEQYRFAGSPLHWDIDFNRGVQYHIQGLIYLNDVPAERGALTLIPGFHHQIETFLSEYSSPELAIEQLRTANCEVAVAGKKGDLIVWLEALPHAASPNHSDQPRFVQYVSFEAF